MSFRGTLPLLEPEGEREKERDREEGEGGGEERNERGREREITREKDSACAEVIGRERLFASGKRLMENDGG